MRYVPLREVWAAWWEEQIKSRSLSADYLVAGGFARGQFSDWRYGRKDVSFNMASKLFSYLRLAPSAALKRMAEFATALAEREPAEPFRALSEKLNAQPSATPVPGARAAWRVEKPTGGKPPSEKRGAGRPRSRRDPAPDGRE